MKKLIVLLLTMVMLFSLAVPAVAAESETADDIVILYTNDVHTYIDGDISYDVIAALKEKLETQYAEVLLVDAGDHIQGTAYGSMDKGKTIIDLMNASGYDLATLGNHEFDYNMQGCMNVIEWAAFPYTSCNFYHEADGVRGEAVLDAYVMFTVGDLQIAFIGITTPETFTKSTPAYFQDGDGNYIYGIAGGSDGEALYTDVQEAIDAAEAEGADMIIALGHLGVDPASRPWTSEEVIANTTGLDAFIDGHSHTTVEGKAVTDEAGGSVLLTQTGEYFDAIGMMVIDGASGEITTDLLTVEDLTDLVPDADVKAIKENWMAEIDEQLGQVIGSTELTFDNYDENGNRLVRSGETNTGDFCADALYYLFDSMDMDVDVAIMNGGGVRNKAVTGDISYQTCKTIHTFGNVACLQTVTGRQILDALEWGARGVGTEEIGGFLHVSGLKYKVNTTVESTVRMDDKGVWTGGPTGEYRVCDVQVYNKDTDMWEELDLSAKYNLAGYNYTLRDLGDGFSMFDGAVNVLDYVKEDYMVLADYVKGFEGGIVEADNSPLMAKYPGLYVDYSNVRGCGRISVCKDADNSGFIDVPADAWYCEGVNYAVEHGLMNGMGNNKFEPYGTTNRAMAVTVLWRMAGSPAAESAYFADVAADSWYADAVNWAAAEDIVLGVGDNRFAPNSTITREQFAVILWRYAKSVGADNSIDEMVDLSDYADASMVSEWSEDAVQWAVSAGVVNGDGGNLLPQAGATRGQSAVMLMRFSMFVG